ncbi:leucyl aminopeptidase [Chitinispirillum alkaliphilum]|nr:leucyl aminopeptidase [Chitinispirillum alkaliphilum]
MNVNDCAVGILTDCLGLKRQEQLLILTDQSGCELGRAMMEAGKEKCKEAVLVVISPKKTDDGLTESVRSWLTQFEAVVVITSSIFDISKILNESSVGTRAVQIPFTGMEDFLRIMCVDWKRFGMFTRKCSALLGSAGIISVKSKNGTDLKFITTGEVPSCDDGRVTNPGTSTVIPAGNTMVNIVEGSAQGTLVLDVCSWGAGKVTCEPLALEIRDGIVSNVKSGKCLREIGNLLSKDRKMRTVGKFCAGTLDTARTDRSYREHLIAKGVVSFGFGVADEQQKDIGGNNYFSGGVNCPDVWLDSRMWIKEGRYV